MGALLKLVDAILFLFFLLVAIASPLIGSQAFPCNEHLPRAMVDLHNWYNRSFGDYLMAEKPHFFVGIVWLELVLLWPLSLINLYGILIAGPWLSTTCLIYGASFFTGMAAKFAELMGSGKAPDKVLIAYSLSWALGALAILRGLLRPHSQSSPSTTIKAKSSSTRGSTIKNPPLARKKRA